MAEDIVGRLPDAVIRAMDNAGTVPAREAVKLRPSDWHAVIAEAKCMADEIERLRSELSTARDAALREAWIKLDALFDELRDCSGSYIRQEAEDLFNALIGKSEQRCPYDGNTPNPPLGPCPICGDEWGREDNQARCIDLAGGWGEQQ